MPALSKYSPEQWTLAQEYITTKSTVPLHKISDDVGIPYDTMYAYAKRKGWLALRDMSEVQRSGAKLHQVIREIAGQTTDTHENAVAMIEALQNSYKIMIIRDNEGHIHYQNMPPTWPTKPANYDQLPQDEKDRALLTIDTGRLESFISSILGVIRLKMDNIQFIAKMIKGSLPKIDPDALDVSRRVGDVTIDLLASDDSRTLADALSSDLKQLRGD